MRGASAFMNGMSKGMVLGKAIRERLDERELQDGLAKAKEAATAQRGEMVDGAVQEVHTPTAQGAANQAAVDSLAEANGTDAIGLMGGAVEGVNPEQVRDSFVDRHNAPGAYAVKGISGRQFATKDEATAAAGQNAPDFQTLYAQKAKDTLVSHYTERGQLDKAQAATEWADKIQGKEFLRSSANVLAALNSGDTEGLNSAFSRLNSVYGQPTTMKAAFNPENPEQVLLETVGQDGKPRRQVLGKGDLMRQFMMQYNPEKGLDMYMKKLDAEDAAKAKHAEEIRGHKLDLHKIEYQETLKAALANKGAKTPDEIAKLGREVGTHAQNYVLDSQKSTMTALEKEIANLEITDPEAAATKRQQLETLRADTTQQAEIASGIASYVMGTENHPLMSKAPIHFGEIAREVAEARKGTSNNVKLSIDPATGNMVEVYAANGQTIRLGSGMPLDMSNPFHKNAAVKIVEYNNIDPQSKQPLMPAEQFAKLKASLGGTQPGQPAQPGTPAPAPAAPRETRLASRTTASPAAKPAEQAAQGITRRPSYREVAQASAKKDAQAAPKREAPKPEEKPAKPTYHDQREIKTAGDAVDAVKKRVEERGMPIRDKAGENAPAPARAKVEVKYGKSFGDDVADAAKRGISNANAIKTRYPGGGPAGSKDAFLEKREAGKAAEQASAKKEYDALAEKLEGTKDKAKRYAIKRQMEKLHRELS